MKQVQAAAPFVNEAAESNGPMIFTRLRVMQAINRHRVAEFGRLR
jgi:hypothetical protein